MHKKLVDKSLIFVTIGLVIFGLIMVYSASNVVAMYKYNDSLYFFKRQLLFSIIGLILMFIVIKINVDWFYKYYLIIFIVSSILLITMNIRIRPIILKSNCLLKK